MKTAELDAGQLNRLVAALEGKTLHECHRPGRSGILRINGPVLQRPHLGGPVSVEYYPMDYNPAGAWIDGGPIIEREKMCSSYFAQTGEPPQWRFWTPATPMMRGPTALIAAMRAFVASKLGEEVELP